MKKLILYALLIAGSIGCSNEYDDSKLWSSINDLENRVTKLEELCRQMNTNISSLQEIVTALQKNESIESVSTLTDGSGYLITFSSGKTITIYHGKNGTDGEDGYDGNDGITPTISVKKDVDGIYYWTVNGEWLIVDGNKVKAEGSDGKDGEDGEAGNDGTDGEDGITPKFKIENDYWYISYDNGESWEQLGKATGDDGLNGADGQSFFKSVSIQDGYVCFILNDLESTTIKLPFVAEKDLTINISAPGSLKHLLTNEQRRSIIQLKIQGNINDEDIKVIRDQMLVLETLDLSETNIMSLPNNAFCYNNHSCGKYTLKKVVLPDTCVKIGDYAFYGCINLEEVYAPSVTSIGIYAFYYCSYIQQLTINGACEQGTSGCFNSPIVNLTISDSSTHANCSTWCMPYNVHLPSSITSVSKNFAYTLQSITFDKDYKCNMLPGLTGTNIEEIEIPKSVEHLSLQSSGSNLSYCTRLTTVIIPKNSLITYFPEGAFTSCPSLKTFICNIPTPPVLISNKPFENTPISTCTLYVPKESINAYSSASIWKNFGVILPIEE